MRAIYKYAIPMVNRFCINAPLVGLTPVHVAVQHDIPCLWFEVDTERPSQAHWFRVVGTGEPIAAEARTHVGTFMVRDGAFVFHVFEALP